MTANADEVRRYLDELSAALTRRGVGPEQHPAILRSVRAHIGATAAGPERSLGPAREYARQFGRRLPRQRRAAGLPTPGAPRG